MGILNKYEERFLELTQHYKKTDFFDGRLCPDQYVGKISAFNEQNYYSRTPENNDIFDYSQEELQIKKSFKSIKKIFLLILESPHVAEYNEQKAKNGYREIRESPFPAMGTTGRNIVSLLSNVNFAYRKLIRERQLILMNAIPFQCSLGNTLGKNMENVALRDKVFSKVWKDFGQRFFEERFGFLLNDALQGKTIVIVNACTQDNDDTHTHNNNGRKHNVTEAILQKIRNNENIELWETKHPSSRWWFVKKFWQKVYPA